MSLAELSFVQILNTDGKLLFTTRLVRLFAYGFLSVILALYLTEVGLSESAIGVLFTFTLLGDAGISLWITTSADRIGRKRMLLLGATLMIFAGITFALTGNFVVLTIAAIIGVISPSGNEIGPFLSIEQAALTQLIPNDQRTRVFAWYNLVGSFATATGALISGSLAQVMQANGYSPLDSYRTIVIGYAIIGFVLIIAFSRLSSSIETTRRTSSTMLGLHRSRNVVFKLSALFALDAFAGGLIVQSLIAYWFQTRWGVEPAVLGSIFFGANILAGISALSAARIAQKIGLINTMVWTHIPSNILLIFVPLMPNLPLAILVLLLRFSISQMDVPTRQSYTMAVVDPDERSAASGVTTIARSVGAAWAPSLTGAMFAASFLSVPFFLAGGLKIIYDLIIWRSFNAVKPPEEKS
ncbi:MAG: MFS transporter [Chloroflexi bacterium]|nr:MFS transporter [Chloroflexota bacterium]